jgi:hypothetical protein
MEEAIKVAPFLKWMAVTLGNFYLDAVYVHKNFVNGEWV